MIKTETKLNVVIKGYYDKPDFKNRFTIDWPFEAIPSIGDYIDIKTFMIDPDERISETYRIDMVQWCADGPYIALLPIK